jgi:hypothetical protein
MSEYVKNLKNVQKEIQDLLKKKTALKKKEQKGQLTGEEEFDLEGITELLATLEMLARTGRLKKTSRIINQNLKPAAKHIRNG